MGYVNTEQTVAIIEAVGDALEKPKCIKDGCFNNAMGHGKGRLKKVCTKHHKERYGMIYGNKLKKAKAKFLNNKCDVCGWDKAPCDRHRLLVGANEYVKGNVVVLCPNCHRLAHLNLLKGDLSYGVYSRRTDRSNN